MFLIEEELKKLKKGKKHYSKDLLKLRDNICKQLKEKYKKDIEVNILADLIDIDENSEVWRNAVEGYLGNQKFNLIIELYADKMFINAENIVVDGEKYILP